MPALAANELDTLRVSAAASVKVPASVLAKSAVLKEPAVVTVPVLATESVASVEPASATDCEPEPSSTTAPLEVMTPVPREMLPATLSWFPAIASVPAVSVRFPERSIGPFAVARVAPWSRFVAYTAFEKLADAAFAMVNVPSGVVPPTAPVKVVVPAESTVRSNAPSVVPSKLTSPAPLETTAASARTTGSMKVTVPPAVETAVGAASEISELPALSSVTAPPAVVTPEVPSTEPTAKASAST